MIDFFDELIIECLTLCNEIDRHLLLEDIDLGWKYVKPIEGTNLLPVIEEKLGIQFPKGYVELATRYNGGSPIVRYINSNMFINSFISIDSSSKYNIADTLDEMYERHKCIPFASDPFGNYFCFKFTKPTTPTVIFWDHELDELIDVADNFDIFVSLLRDKSGSGSGSGSGSNLF